MKQILLSRLLNLSSQSIGVGFVMVARIKERDGKPLDEYISDPVAFHNKRFKFGKLDHRHDGIYFFFLELSSGLWLVTSCKKVTNGVISEVFEEYCGRLIVSFEKTNRSGNICLRRQIDRMYVHSIIESTFSYLRFKSYNETRLAFSELKKIVNEKLDDWYNALKAVSAIYLISDKMGGAYVGSASGDEGLWGRWSVYANGRFEGNGNDKGLIKRINGDKDYADRNFTFSILEILRKGLTQNEVVARENWWKETLQTRLNHNNNGMNEN